MRVTTRGPSETEAVAADLAAKLAAGDVVTLDGDLGAGKTCFTRGLVAGLGGEPRQVSSPTYTLLQTYTTPTLVVHHLDAYRLSSADDLDAIGFDDLLGDGGVVVIEWPSRVADALPAGRWEVRIDHAGEGVREIDVARTES